VRRSGFREKKTWLEDPPPWLLLCFGNSVNRKMLPCLTRFICLILTLKQSATTLSFRRVHYLRRFIFFSYLLLEPFVASRTPDDLTRFEDFLTST